MTTGTIFHVTSRKVGAIYGIGVYYTLEILYFYQNISWKPLTKMMYFLVTKNVCGLLFS